MYLCIQGLLVSNCPLFNWQILYCKKKERFSILFSLPAACSIIARTRSKCKLQWMVSVKTRSTFSQQIQCKLYFCKSSIRLFTLWVILQSVGLIWKVSHRVSVIISSSANQSPEMVRADQWEARTLSRRHSLVYRWHFHIQRENDYRGKVWGDIIIHHLI